jgi:hypothetical protein
LLFYSILKIKQCNVTALADQSRNFFVS